MEFRSISEIVYRQRPIWLLFAFSMGMMLYGQDMETASPTDLSVQLEIISSNREFDIPSVFLTDRTDQFSNKVDTITSSLVYNTNANEALVQGYYYWNEGRWHSLFSKTNPADYLFLWNVEKVELTYLDKSGDVRVVGIGGIENAKFLTLESDSKTLKYESETGGRMLVDLGQIVGEEHTVKTLIYHQDSTILFIDTKGSIVSVALDKGPQEVMFVTEDAAGSIAFEETTNDRLVQADPAEASLTSGMEEVSNIEEKAVAEVENSDVVIEEAVVVENETEADEEGVDNNQKTETNTISKKKVEEKEEVRLGREIKSIEDNEDGTFTIVYAGGSKFTSRDISHPEGGLKNVDRDLVDVVNNGDGSFTAVFSDGTTLLSSEMKDFQNFGGSPEDGYPGVEIVIDNGDGTYNIILTDGTELSSVDLEALSNPKREEEEGRGVLSIMKNEDETYTVTFTDGTQMNSKDLSEIYQSAEQPGVLEEKVKASEADQTALDEKKAEIMEMSGLGDVEDPMIQDDGIEEEQVERGIPQSRGVKAIEERNDGAYVISLTDGTSFVTPSFYAEGDDRSEVRHIESIVDNNDGTFIVGLTGGMKLASIETLSLPDPIRQTPMDVGVPDTEEAGVSGKVEIADEIEEITAEKTLIDDVEKPNDELTDQSEQSEIYENVLEDPVEEDNIDEEVLPAKEEEMDLKEGESNELDSLESDANTEDARSMVSQEELIRLQKEEIEALKRKDKENEEELREMNVRLKRLEEAFGNPNKSVD